MSSISNDLPGRIGPDIVAPGYRVRVPNFTSEVGESTTTDVLGTSIASPVAAGTAALIRQYFMEGWYPCGWKKCGEQFKPSGSLIKAVMLNGAQALKGIDNLGTEDNSEEYDNNQGFGLINLVKTVPLYGKNKINMVVVNEMDIDQEGKQDQILVKVRKGDKCNEDFLSVTMSYYAMGNFGCTQCSLNNIDLRVQRVKRRGKESVYYPNGGKKSDEKNNNERVKIKVKNKHTYRIIVELKNINPAPVGHKNHYKSSYSLAMTGCFQLLTVSDENLLCTAES